MTLSAYLSARSAPGPNGCVLWTGSKTKGGYGTANYRGQKTTAHRLAFINAGREIPAGLELDHICKTPACVNPDHLEPVTHIENVRRSSKAQQSKCIHGHDFTDANTYRKKSNGCRTCRVCAAIRQKSLRSRRKTMKTFANQVAQGDMLLRRIDHLPAEAEAVTAEKGAYVLAHSETGHNHIVKERPDVRLYQNRQNLFLSWLVVEGEPVELEHQRDFHTHEAIQVGPGIYEVRRQREYTPEGYRRAQD